MNLFYTKTVLYAYPNIEAVMEQIDDLVERKALSSINDFTPCLQQCEKILDFTQQKKALIDLKVMADQALERLTKEQSDCLEYKYFKRKPKEYFSDMDTDSRGYFRRQVSLVNKMAKLFDKVGITDEWFSVNCLNMDFFKELLRRVISYEEQCKKNKSKCAVNKSDKSASKVILTTMMRKTRKKLKKVDIA